MGSQDFGISPTDQTIDYKTPSPDDWQVAALELANATEEVAAVLRRLSATLLLVVCDNRVPPRDVPGLDSLSCALDQAAAAVDRHVACVRLLSGRVLS